MWFAKYFLRHDLFLFMYVHIEFQILIKNQIAPAIRPSIAIRANISRIHCIVSTERLSLLFVIRFNHSCTPWDDWLIKSKKLLSILEDVSHTKINIMSYNNSDINNKMLWTENVVVFMTVFIG